MLIFQNVCLASAATADDNSAISSEARIPCYNELLILDSHTVQSAQDLLVIYGINRQNRLELLLHGPKA